MHKISALLFIGDFIYPTTLYARPLPGASLVGVSLTAKMLLGMLPADTVLRTAHCCRANEGVVAPWLDQGPSGLGRSVNCRANWRGKIIAGVFTRRVHPVNEEMTLATRISLE